MKIIRLCRNTDKNEAKSAAERALKEIAHLKPTMWRWPAEIEVARTATDDGKTWIKRRLKHVLMVSEGMVSYRLLHRSLIAVRLSHDVLLLPADSMEPMW